MIRWTNKPYTPERAYRWSVCPLAALFAFGGPVFAIAIHFVAEPAINRVLFVDSYVANRAIFSAIGILVCAIGIGLFLKSRIAWYALFGYLLSGTVWGVAKEMVDPDFGEAPNIAMAVTLWLFNTALGVGIFFATRPVFQPGSRDGETNSDPTTHN